MGRRGAGGRGASLAASLLTVSAVAGCTAEPSRGGPAAPTPAGGAAASQQTAGEPRAARDGPGVTGPGAPSKDASTASQDLPPFAASTSRIGPDLRRRMRASYHAGCPVPLRDLRYLRVRFVTFDGAAARGEVVVHADAAEAVVSVFRRLYAARWPIRRMRLVDEYGADDDRSMAADNTSGFNCRRVAGTDRWSEHAYGRALDINPVQNPYVRGSTVSPPRGRRYALLDRSAGAQVPPGVIHAGDVVVTAFEDVDWEWGGLWSSAKDYQHFSAAGR